jgi:hypothetical protein
LCGLMLSGNFIVSSRGNYPIHLRQKRDNCFLRRSQAHRKSFLAPTAAAIIIDAKSSQGGTVAVRLDV